MIAYGSKYKKRKGSILLAKDNETNQSIFYVPDEEYPLQRIRGSPLQLINQDELLGLFKKHSLKKAEISKLINFYREPDETTLELGDDFKLRLCFKKLEEMMLNALKTTFLDPSAELQVYHNPDLLLGIALIGPTAAGKTWMAGNILLRPEFAKIKCYIFTLNPSDPSITRLKARGKYSVFVDLNQITSPLKLTRDVSPGSLLLFDDIFSLKRGENEDGHNLRKNLTNLINQTLSRGRHHRKTKTSRGCSAIICAHLFKNAHDSRVLWNEVNALYVYPSSSPHQIKDFVIKKLGIHKRDVEAIMAFAKGSRHICFKISGKPMYATWETGMMLL